MEILNTLMTALFIVQEILHSTLREILFGIENGAYRFYEKRHVLRKDFFHHETSVLWALMSRINRIHLQEKKTIMSKLQEGQQLEYIL